MSPRTTTSNLVPINPLFLSAPKTDFAEFLREIDEFIQDHPEVIEAIEEDLDKRSKSKKEMRLREEQYRKDQAQTLEGFEEQQKAEEQQELTLKQGRPRTEGYLLFVFMMCRGYFGEVSTRKLYERLADSMAFHVILGNRGSGLPARSTIIENLNAISNQTRLKVLEAQCERISQQGLDDLKKMTLDSTAVKANSEWPTDALIIKKLIERVWREGTNLEEFGLENFRRHWMETWIEKIQKRVLKINTADSKQERKKHYRRLYHFAENAWDHLTEERERFEESVGEVSLSPREEKRLVEVRDQIRSDLKKARTVIDYSKRRVLEEKQVDSKKKCIQ